MIPKSVVFALLISCPLWLFSQTVRPETLPAEAVANALTKRMQGELQLSKEQLAGIHELNHEYSEAVSRLHRSQEGHSEASLRTLIPNWEAALRELFSTPQRRTFQRVRNEYITELQLAGLQRSTARLALELKLAPAQITRVEALETEFFPQITEVRTGGDPARIKMRRLRGLQQEKEEKLQQILTAPQFEEYREMIRKQ